MCIGYIYEAFDSQMNKSVALKMEKKDKSKNILKFEYTVLQQLKGKHQFSIFYRVCPYLPAWALLNDWAGLI